MIALPNQAQHIIDSLKTAGFEAFAVGGSVRDIILGRPTKGWDFTTNATPEEILTLFPDSFYDNQFGTVGIKIKENEIVADIYEVTTYRSEKGYKDHRHPDAIIWGKTIAEDLGRRDFTVNAIAYDGKILIDPFDGQKDLATKTIRAVGNPKERFCEDALRMMRAVRIATELGFMIESETLEGIKENTGLLQTISVERIHDELLRILAASYAADGFTILKNTGLLALILPELDRAFDTPQKSPQRHHIYDVGTHSVMSLKFCPSRDPVVRFATLLHDIGKPKTFQKDERGVITFYNHEVVSTYLTRNILKRLRFSKKDTDKILSLIRWHQFSVDERQTDSALRRFIRRVGKENLNDILDLRIGDRLGGGARETSWRLELYKKRLIQVQLQPFSVRDLKVNGLDVMGVFACRPGPVVGITLDQLFVEVEEEKLQNEREALLSRIRELKSSSSASPNDPTKEE